MTEQTGASMEERLLRLEDELNERARLAQGVERLSGDVGDLNTILGRVDEQQRQLAVLSSRTGHVEDRVTTTDRKSEAMAFTVEERAATTRIERKLFLRRVYASSLGALILAVASVIGGAWFTDQHVQHCLVHGPATPTEARLCDLTFPGHSHPVGDSLDELIRRQATNAHNSCLNLNRRTQINIDRELKLAKSDALANREAHSVSAQLQTQLLVNCDVTSPLPKEKS